MARNAEVVRQWEILRAIDGARHGIGVAKLASERGVHERTIRRDLDALGRAGFPLVDTRVNGSSRWKLIAKPFHGLEELGLSLTELCALYFSHEMLRTLAGTPLLSDAEHAFHKIEKALPRGCRKFIDRLPRVLRVKAAGRKKQDDRRLREVLARVLDATLLHRRATMRYASAASGRTGQYVVEAQRIAYAHGGIYVVAWVPAYGEMRTFAAERIQAFGLLDDHFEPRPLPTEPFANSLGVHTGAPQRIVIEFDASAAPYVREREWHRTQSIEERPGGGLVLTLDVCDDPALRAWVLGFGPAALVIEPVELAQHIFEAAEATHRRYTRRLAKGRIEMLSIRAS